MKSFSIKRAHEITYVFVCLIFVNIGWGQYTVNFDGASDATSASAYGFTNHNLNGITWNGVQAIVPNPPQANDWFNGTRSLRLRGYSTSSVTMSQNKSNGIGTISFDYIRYGTDGQVSWLVEYSTDNGSNWTNIGGFVAGTSVATFSETVNVTGDVRIRIIHNSGGNTSTNRRMNIDDLLITDYTSGCLAPSSQATNLSFTSISDVNMDVNWANGNGDGRVVIMNTTNSFTAPGNGSNPTANSVYAGSGQQVVYNGAGNGPISITNLNPNTTYWFRVYEFCDPDRVYQTATNTDNPNSASTLACVTSTHFFRSVGSGDWNSVSTWESSPNQISWGTPSCVPDFNANVISIENGHIVSITSNLDVDQVLVQAGGTLRHEAGVLTIRNGAGHDLIISNTGVLEYAGGLAPTYANADARISVSAGGIIRVSTSTSGLSDNLAGNLSSNRVIYNSNSVFDWNNNLAFASANQNYFPDVDATTQPIFRVSSNSGTIGAGSPTVINGLFECNGNITFNSAGTKTFRNGIVGTGNITQGSTCGTFIINGEIAFLGGSGVLNLNNTPLFVSNNATLVLTSNKTINTTGATPDGQIQLDNGTTFDLALYELSGSGSALLNSTVIIRTSHANGLDGALNSLASVDFVAPYNQTLDFYAAGVQNSGFVSPGACSNLITGAGTWLQLVENLDVSNTITMNNGARITVAAGETLRLTNPAVSALVGGNLVGATNYIHGRLQRATTTGNTYQFPLGYPGFNAQGFTITVTGSGEILGNMEANTSAPLLNYAYCDLETPTIAGQQIGQGLPVPDGILDQMFLDLQSPTQWEITNPGGGITSYDLVLSANGMNDIMPVSSSGGTPIRFVMKNGEPGNTGVSTTSTAEFTQLGFDACPNGYSLTGMTGFSTFTINGSSAPNTALPVEFLFFTASLNNQNEVILNWATASELNNDFFTVERSVDGLTWEVVDIVNGSGTTPIRNDYNAKDLRPYSGLSYYRLKQTDFDGAFEYADIVSIFISSEDKSLIKIVNLIGQEVDLNTRGMVILIFSDGSTLKVINE